MEHLLGNTYKNENLFPMKSYQITDATFKSFSLNEIPLTSYTQKVSKITPSEDATIQASGVMSLSGTSEHPVSKTTDKKQKTKKYPSTSKPKASSIVIQTLIPQASTTTEVPADITKQSLEASKSTEEQDNQPQTDDTEKEQEHKVTEDKNIGDDDELVDPWTPILRFRQQNNHDEPLIPTQYEINEDSDLASIPDDDIYSISDSQPSETEDERETDKVCRFPINTSLHIITTQIKARN
ncbi:hypothetical protein Tco_0837762 [Tanacetum coccineum]